MPEEVVGKEETQTPIEPHEPTPDHVMAAWLEQEQARLKGQVTLGPEMFRFLNLLCKELGQEQAFWSAVGKYEAEKAMLSPNKPRGPPELRGV